MTQVRPMRADARRNYARLLETAARAFAEHGEGASLDDIARRAGVGSGTLYRHFPTRQALLEAAYLDRIEALAARAGALGRELPPGEALTAWLEELCVGTIQVRGMRALLGSAVADGGAAAVTGCGTRMKAAAARLVEAAQRAGALRRDVDPIDVLRLAHGVATASELAAGDGGCTGDGAGGGDGGSRGDGAGRGEGGDVRVVRRYVSLLTEGLRPPR